MTTQRRLNPVYHFDEIEFCTSIENKEEEEEEGKNKTKTKQTNKQTNKQTTTKKNTHMRRSQIKGVKIFFM